MTIPPSAPEPSHVPSPAELALVQRIEAAWAIDTAPLECARVEIDAPFIRGEVLRCACPDRALCRSLMTPIHERSDSYTSGRGEREWDEHHSRGLMHIHTFPDDPSRFFEMFEEDAELLEQVRGTEGL